MISNGLDPIRPGLSPAAGLGVTLFWKRICTVFSCVAYPFQKRLILATFRLRFGYVSATFQSHPGYVSATERPGPATFRHQGIGWTRSLSLRRYGPHCFLPDQPQVNPAALRTVKLLPALLIRPTHKPCTIGISGGQVSWCQNRHPRAALRRGRHAGPLITPNCQRRSARSRHTQFTARLPDFCERLRKKGIVSMAHARSRWNGNGQPPCCSREMWVAPNAAPVPRDFSDPTTGAASGQGPRPAPQWQEQPA